MEEKMEQLAVKANANAKRRILFGLSMCCAQLFGYGYMIYGPFSWDVIEPITYLTGAFYATVSMTFYMKYRDDFEWGNAYEVFKSRKLNKLYAKHGIDKTKLEFMKTYKADLEESLAYMQR
jgi:hypothetical protein